MAQDVAGAATLLIGQRVRSGREDDYQQWQKKLGAAAARYPGFRGVELRRPSGEQTDWIVVYQFDSVANMQKWINSATRQEFLDRGTDLFDGPGTRQVIVQDSKVDDTLVTVVVSHEVAADQVEDFLAWQAEVNEVESTFAGFRGSEIFRPVEGGLQDEWTICYKFDNAEHLDAWLTSDERQRLLADDRFADFTLRRIDHSFGSWFDYGATDAPPPLGLQDLDRGVDGGALPHRRVPHPAHRTTGHALWLGMLVGNLLSSFVMSYVTMPFYGVPHPSVLDVAREERPPTPHQRQGFRPRAGHQRSVGVIFYLVTVKFWTLP